MVSHQQQKYSYAAQTHIPSGLVLSQAIFLAYMVVLRKSVNAGMAAFLIVFTVLVKIMYVPP